MGNGMGRLNGAGLNCMTGHKDIVNRGAQSIDNLANQGAQSVNGLTGAVQSLQQLVGTQADSLGQGLHAFLEKQGIILQQGAKVFGDAVSKAAMVGGTALVLDELCRLQLSSKQASAQQDRAAAAKEHVDLEKIHQSRQRVKTWISQHHKRWQGEDHIKTLYICRDEPLYHDLNEDPEIPEACKVSLYLEYSTAISTCIDLGYDKKGLVILYDLTYSPKSPGEGVVDVRQLHKCIIQGSPLNLTQITRILFRDTEQPSHVFVHKVHITGRGWVKTVPAPPPINVIDMHSSYRLGKVQMEARAIEERKVVVQFAQERYAVADDQLGPIAEEYENHTHSFHNPGQESPAPRIKSYMQDVAQEEKRAWGHCEQVWKKSVADDQTSPEAWLHLARAKQSRLRALAVSRVADELRRIAEGVAHQQEEDVWASVQVWLKAAKDVASAEKAEAAEMVRNAEAGLVADGPRMEVLKWTSAGWLLPHSVTTD